MPEKNNKWQKYAVAVSVLGLLIVILFAMLGYADSYSKQNSTQDVKIDNNCGNIKKNTEKIENNNKDINKLRIDHTQLEASYEKDIQHIKEGQEETNRNLRSLIHEMKRNK